MTQPHGQWPPPQHYPTPYSPQPPYGYGRYPQPRNGLGTAGFVCGLIGAVTGFLPGPFSLVALPLAILGVVLGGIGYSHANRGLATNRSLATAGVVLGSLTLGLVLIGLLVVALT